MASDSIRTATRWHHNNETDCLRSDLLLETVQMLEMVLSLRVTSRLLIWGLSFEKQNIFLIYEELIIRHVAESFSVDGLRLPT